MHHFLSCAGLVSLLAVAACHGGTPSAAQPSAEQALSRVRVVQDPSLQKLLDDEKVFGTIAILRDDDDVVACADTALCTQRVLPASTFKIPNALIGLETGVIPDAEFTIPWDGVTREFADWNRDQTLRSAIRVSAVPYFQELARRVGFERMALWTRKLGYGNAETGDASQVDDFWLQGPLAISPLEQLVFLRRFARGELPVSPRAMQTVRDILVLTDGDNSVLRGKTGWGHPHQPDQVGWFVGYVEGNKHRTYVAVLLRDPTPPPAVVLPASAPHDAGALHTGSYSGASGDAGARDAGSSDAGARDAGPYAAGPHDAGPRDAGPRDAATRQAGPSKPTALAARDAGPRDAAIVQTAQDASVADASVADAGPRTPVFDEVTFLGARRRLAERALSNLGVW